MKKSSSSKFPTNLGRLREMAGLSQWDVARKLACDRSKVSQIESGYIVPRPEELATILKTIRAAHQKLEKEFQQQLAAAGAAAA